MKRDLPSAFDSDLICVGFGPAAIALACAIADWSEANGRPPYEAVTFLERASSTQWQPELLLPGTDINHHPLRDLVTPRDPRSRYSFAMYLKENGRLYRFSQLGRPASRFEWSDYVSWVAGQLSQYVAYDEPVRQILPQTADGRLTGLQVVTSKGVRRTRRLVLANGSHPRVPEVFRAHLGERVFHTAQYLSAVAAPALADCKRWLVVGSGQSASEAIADLLRRHPDALIESLHRSSGFKITQLGHFPNLAFSPERVDYFHDLEPDARRRLLAEVKATNYSGIDPDESLALYSLVYEDQLAGRERLNVHVFQEAVEIERDGAAYRVAVRDVFNGSVTWLNVDAIVIATGYEQPLIPPLLAELQPWLVIDGDGGITIGRDYRIETENADVEIFANGLSERAHGIGDGQSFSLMAMRAERILASLLARNERPQEVRSC
ncbi:L-lysine 6-monooxygenase [Burkholderia singularis]|uniref:L-lysine 6-monooxygenase n=1 Tax=Burkholderia singularis TaxID=1503053 RepID=A0A103E5D3_9BURK|nr:SidA/IucD/PvdA family monooxygenase [Burkholderia singularis]KVE28650.1 L-lysine 6-monooxygenase [Burkholderia singularis]